MTEPIDKTLSRRSGRQTIGGLLTPRGRGAVAVIAIAGPATESVLDLQFQPANQKTLAQNSTRTIIYGLWKATGEDLVVFRRGEHDFEIHCHGGNSASAAILDSLIASGVDLVSAAEFMELIENPWKMGVWAALAEASTALTAEYLLKQLEVLPNAIAQLESKIGSGQLESASSQLEQILRWSDFAIHLTQPRSIVLCGQPNVGKSSLANAIIGFERAIVHNVPGTTRDVVSQLTAIDGWPVELKDTAGLRESTEPIEAIGIEKAKAQIESADVRVCVFDVTTPWTQSDLDTIRAVDPHLVVYNKSDLALESDDSTSNWNQSIRPRGILTSAETGRGVAELIRAISELLVPDLPDPNQPFPVTAAQSIRLQTVLNVLRISDSDSAIRLLGH